MDDKILKTAKEIVVKFIEAGRVSPTNFDESFKGIYRTLVEAVEECGFDSGPDDDADQDD
ncbi:MAG: hypothetical protein QMD09_10205 [Desulfatibacillaceae bacterium]|nr:hypothetical protein [Desulfatibacillaceae bacterium]